VSVLLDLFNPDSRKRTRVEREPGSRLFRIISEQDCASIAEECKRRSSMFDRHMARAANLRGAGTVQVAEIPMVIYHQLRRAGIAQNPQRLKKWLSRRDSRAFRVDDGRPLA
jgi:hypothetical protein